VTEPMVPNPRHATLKALLGEAEERAHQVRQAYRHAFSAMRSRQVWTGPSAERWTDDLEEKNRRLERLAQRVADRIEEELRRHPTLVTEAEADAMRRQMAGRL
jgi:uncharacterized protein YukE